MTDILTRAKEALEGTTEGPWSVEYKHGDNCFIQNGECTMCDMTYYPWTPDNLRDWEFFAAAPDLVRDFIAEVERMREGLDQAEENLSVLAAGLSPKRQEELENGSAPQTIGEHIWSCLMQIRRTRAALEGDKP